MKKTFSIIAIVLVIVVAIALLMVGYRLTHRTPPPVNEGTKEIYKFDPFVCPGPTRKFLVQDPYMRGTVEEGQEVQVTLNWYKCNPIAKGDIVLYRYSWKMDPVIRRVVATGGDKLHLAQDPKADGWVILVNNQVIEGEGKPYSFGVAGVAPPLKLYEERWNGIVKPDHVIVLSNFGPGDRDSGTFGAVAVGDIVGRIQTK